MPGSGPKLDLSWIKNEGLPDDEPQIFVSGDDEEDEPEFSFDPDYNPGFNTATDPLRRTFDDDEEEDDDDY